MERLTERFENGQVGVAGCGGNCKYNYKYCENARECCPAFERIYEKLAEYEDGEEQGLLLRLPCKEASRMNNKWISVTERLPEDGINVLVWFEYFRYGDYNRLFQKIGISYTHNGEWSGFVNGQSGWRQLKVIAWMPLPEPYRESEE